jgi:hypothetical protein
MAAARPDEATIRERAYLLWEQEGRPEGRETEFWMRAEAAVTESAQLQTLTQTPPKRAKAKEAKVSIGKAKTAPAKSKKK